MKTLLAFAFVVLSGSVFALDKELVLQTSCGGGDLNHNQGFTYMNGYRAEDTRVKAVLVLAESSFGESTYSEIKTNIIASLERQGMTIVHTPTGTICAEFRKAGIIGRKMWVKNSACFFTLIEEGSSTPDEDDFETTGSCVRSYFLNIR